MFQTKSGERWLWSTILATVISFSLVASPVMAKGPGGGGGDCGGGGGQTTPLSDYEKQALSTALDEEYNARAVYLKVLDTFGPIEPFPWIIRDEGMHINWVVKLLVKYGLPVPPDRWSGNIALEFVSKQEACEVGAQAEDYNASVYDGMIPGVAHSDIVSTFSKLRDVFRYRHLPAFRNWADIYGAAGE